MTCDHQASRASLSSFIASTNFIGFQSEGEGDGWLLMGTCRGCKSTLAVEIQLRGATVSGTIEPGPVPSQPIDEPPPVRGPSKWDVRNLKCGHYGCDGNNCDNDPPF